MKTAPAKYLSLAVICLSLAAFIMLPACGDDGLGSKCIKACVKLVECNGEELDEMSCRYQCAEPDLLLNEELADCILEVKCSDILDVCY